MSLKRTAAELRQLGYDFKPSEQAEDCLEISLDRPFGFWNPNHLDLTRSPEQVFESLRKSHHAHDRNVMLIANLTEADLENYILVDQNELYGIQLVHARIDAARRAAELAEQQFKKSREDLAAMLGV